MLESVSQFWMLGSTIDGVGWPACGEIDIMEGKVTVAGNCPPMWRFIL
jgi:beta-glucanase (GH16 family)